MSIHSPARDLFAKTRAYLTTQKDVAPEYATEHVSKFSVAPESLDVPTMQLLASAINAMDPTMEKGSLVQGMLYSQKAVLDETAHRHGHVLLNGKHDRFPTSRLSHQLQRIHAGLQAQMKPGNEGSLYFTAPADGLFDIDYVLRAALPISRDALLPESEQLKLFYRLPEGEEFRKFDGTRISGTVSYSDLIDAIGFAEHELNYSAYGALVGAKCDHAIVPASQAARVLETLGLSSGPVLELARRA